ncbi:MAG: hypothetical protein EBE86_028565 [Hormoscilla sp. GUM202]|nr:hypothetical protein [Hormoscilla sp. GUM202]
MPLLSQIEIRAMQVQQEVLRSARESVVEVLEVRFQEVPEAIADTINSIEDVAFLKQSHWQAIVIGSLVSCDRTSKCGDLLGRNKYFCGFMSVNCYN